MILTARNEGFSAENYMNTILLNNRYQILQTIGRGGFGETFLAIDTHMPSARKCVIKQLKPLIQEQKNSQWVQEQFQREARILEQLGEGCSQIPRLYAYFSEGGNFYLVQEYIEGLNLKERLEQKGLFSQEEVKAILLNLLPVLDYVHGKRLVHRDVKPENIILRAADGKPVLIDFGALKETMATMLNHSSTVPYSVAIGTPGYMPSEQAAGRPVYSSDLYSLGLTAVYLLTGKSPQYLTSDPQSGEIIWRQQAANINTDLAMAIDRAIRFHPRDRFASAREMLRALQSPTIHSNAATLAVSPGNLRPNPNPSSTTSNTASIVPPSYSTIEENNGWKKLMLVLFVFGIVSGSMFAIGFNLFNERQKERAESTSQQPIFEEPFSTPTPTPTPEPTPIPTPTPEPTPTSEPVITPEPIPIPEPTPEPIPTPTPTPEPTPTPTPTPEASQAQNIDIPLLIPGIQENKVIETLGKPSSVSQGYWPNSQGMVYDNFVPDRVSLGYIVDNSTRKIRQSEVSFSQSVDLAQIKQTLNNLLGGSAPPEAIVGLEQIYNRQNDLRSFSTGALKGMIKRSESDRIYIGIWEADFH